MGMDEITIGPFEKELFGPYVLAKDVLKERLEVARLYNFYYGKTRATSRDIMNDDNRGQSWLINPSLDYLPSQDIRNHAKRLIKRQGRFMFGVAPDILFKGYDRKENETLEDLRQFFDNKVFEENEFWKDTYKAFIDCTIGKRILLRIEANKDEPIGLHYHTMDEFTFEVDPRDYRKLNKVIIAYIEGDTAKKLEKEQVWKRWKYYIENGRCMLEYGTYNGACVPIDVEIIDTGFSEIPCRVIINDGLTGDIIGASDLEDLLDLQDGYNKTNSDYRDALRFKMFEQPVFIDADDSSTENIKIAPNAIIDLKTDPANESSKADAKMLSSTFNFSAPADSFTTGIKNDMYEIMDQPKPEDIKNAQSGKALKMTFWDLQSRCEEKWVEWGSAFKWAISYIINAIEKLDLYKEHWNKEWADIDYKIVIKHNYPIPDDDNEKKTIAIEEVNSKVRSIKSYIKDISDEEDSDGEYNQILKEMKDFMEAENNDFVESVQREVDTLENDNGNLEDDKDDLENNNNNLNIQKGKEDLNE